MKKTVLQCLMVLIIILTGVACVFIAVFVKLLRYIAGTDTQTGALLSSDGAHQPQPAYNFTRVVFDKETKQLKRIIKI